VNDRSLPVDSVCVCVYVCVCACVCVQWLDKDLVDVSDVDRALVKQTCYGVLYGMGSGM